jgi:dienelactone hydrolase
MKQQPDGVNGWRILVISFVVALACACQTMEGSSQREYDPPSGRGPIVILLSGYSGLDMYLSYAAEVARLGYYAVLLDGKDVSLGRGMYGEDYLRRAIEQAQRSPKALPGKAVVIGFSMGGGGALAHAAHMPDIVSAVVAYYPLTKDVLDMRSFVARFQIPILVLAAGLDPEYCPIESMRAMETAAKEGRTPFELVVYPNAYHAFTWENTPIYRPEDVADAWQRTTKMLSQYQPLR